jgi:hypothetical protein
VTKKVVHEYTTVRISSTTRKRLGKVVEALVRSGWNAVGADRVDAPGVGTVLDQALVLLEERLKKEKA